MRQGGLQLVSELAARIAATLARSNACVLVTVVGTQGSVPREVGAAMLVADDQVEGTVGGGKLEYLATRRARSMLADDEDWLQFLSLALEAESNQCCGGVVVLALLRLTSAHSHLFDQWRKKRDLALCVNRFSRDVRLAQPTSPITDATLTESELVLSWRISARPVFLCGAGHVGQAIADALTPLPFSVTWWDERSESAPQRTVTRSPEIPEPVDGSLWLILTHRHDLDLELCRRALRSNAAFIGLIGSRSKLHQFTPKLAADGFGEEEIAQITCPIGLPEIKGKSPQIIAASVAAQLLTLIPPTKVGSGIRESEVESAQEYWL